MRFQLGATAQPLILDPPSDRFDLLQLIVTIYTAREQVLSPQIVLIAWISRATIGIWTTQVVNLQPVTLHLATLTHSTRKTTDNPADAGPGVRVLADSIGSDPKPDTETTAHNSRPLFVNAIDITRERTISRFALLLLFNLG